MGITLFFQSGYELRNFLVFKLISHLVHASYFKIRQIRIKAITTTTTTTTKTKIKENYVLKMLASQFFPGFVI
ncbi:hypothetical protein DERF_008069 [Dermatophagoides farinae]|uniref:Uncharacterized protein n=1 Tax=Dermatophagoides farinae TaxID=6954 RepID=A0A922L3W9_DERFA|nr:hypothetical protein DERF_008069 [Dermatophagoides farinae]